MLHVSPESPTSQVATELTAALGRELIERYPGEAGDSLIQLDDSAGPRAIFLIAWFGGEGVGCGALGAVDDETAELKRMYVAPSARGRGIGREILRELERRAATFGYRRIILQTGARQPEAVALFEKNGFEKIPAFGRYVGNAHSVCFAKSVASAANIGAAE